ncbi:MAG: aminotransferase class IV [Candidatus Altiarchaeota archaeon]
MAHKTKVQLGKEVTGGELKARSGGLPDLRPVRDAALELIKKAPDGKVLREDITTKKGVIIENALVRQEDILRLAGILDADTTHGDCKTALSGFAAEKGVDLNIDSWVQETKDRLKKTLTGDNEVGGGLNKAIDALSWGLVRGKLSYKDFARNRKLWTVNSGVDPTTPEGQESLANRINTFVKGTYQRHPKAKQVLTGWHDGNLDVIDRINVPTISPTVNYGGGGVFEGMVGYLNVTSEGKLTANIVDPKGHYDRLVKGVEALGRELPFTYEEFRTGLADVISANKGVLKDGDYRFYLRPVTSIKMPKGREHTGIGLKQSDKPLSLSIFTLPFGPYLDEKGSYVLASERIPPVEAVSDLKLGGKYAPHMAIKESAVGKGFTEALCLDMDGGVAEGTGENFYIIKNDPTGGAPTLITPKPGKGILQGRTRSIVMDLARDIGWKVEESDGISITEVVRADEAMITGTAGEVGGIKKFTLPKEVAEKIQKGKLMQQDGANLENLIGEHQIGSGEIGPHVRKLQEAYNTIYTLDRQKLEKFVGASNVDKYFDLIEVIDLGRAPDGFKPRYPG